MNGVITTPVAFLPPDPHVEITSELSNDEQDANRPADDPCYIVERSPDIGRYLVASRAVQAGEMIIDGEEPLVVGPKQATHPVCLTCYRRVDGTYRCSRCNWPLCSSDCESSGNDDHHAVECALLAAQQIYPADEELDNDDCKIYDCIAPLRMVLLDRDAIKWRLVSALEDHLRHRKASGIWYVDRLSVVEPILLDWQLGDRLSGEDLQLACGILEVNAFEVCSGDDVGDDGGRISARAIYSSACLMAHDCVPNTACTVDPSSARMTVRAAVDIPAGAMITTSYTFTLDGTQRRRNHLRETKFFSCSCQRCRSNTELDTHLSSITCPKCCQSYAVPEEPLSGDSSWCCLKDECRARVSSVQVQQLLDCLQRKADALNYDDYCGLEAFLRDWTPVLHPNHSILIGIKYYLSHFYGNAPGFHLDQMPVSLVRRKIQLCQELMAVADILEPGASKLRCNLLKEWRAAEDVIANEAESLETTELPELPNAKF